MEAWSSPCGPAPWTRTPHSEMRLVERDKALAKTGATLHEKQENLQHVEEQVAGLYQGMDLRKFY